ncbi:hypothetical protein AAEP93_009433 [Penicillium crustosum]
MIYATSVTFTKSSIVFFYGRIFNFRWSLGWCMFVVLGYWVTIMVTVAVACRPLPCFWLAYTDPTATGVCIDVPTFFFGNGIGAMLVDVIILCMPLPTIYKLQMQLSQKIAFMGILLLGSLYVFTSCYYFILASCIQRLCGKYLPNHRTSEKHPQNRCYMGHGTMVGQGLDRAGRSSNSRSTDPSDGNSSATKTWLRKPLAKTPPKDSFFSINDFECIDEVQLMNDITVTRSSRDGAVSDHQDVEQGHSGSITVQQDVDALRAAMTFHAS